MYAEIVNGFMELKKKFNVEDDKLLQYKEEEHHSNDVDLRRRQIYLGECVTMLPIMVTKEASPDELERLTTCYYVLLRSEKLGLNFRKAWTELKMDELREMYKF